MEVTPQGKKVWHLIFEKTENLTKPAKFSRSELGEFGTFDIQITLDMINNIIRKGNIIFKANDVSQKYYNLPKDDITINNLDYYFDKASSMNLGKAVTISKNYCLESSVAVKHKVEAFTSGYIAEKNIVTPGVNTTLEVGNHKTDSQTLRQDFCDSFEFNLLGKKNIYLWPPCYFNNFDYDQTRVTNGIAIKENYIKEHLNYASEIKLSPGEMFFIPQDWWWHTKGNPLTTSLTLDIGIFNQCSAKKLAINALNSSANEMQYDDKMIKAASATYSLDDSEWSYDLDGIILDHHDSVAISYNCKSNCNESFEMDTESLIDSSLFYDLIVSVNESSKILYTEYKNSIVCFSNGRFKQFAKDDLIVNFLEDLIENRVYILDETILSKHVLMLISWLCQVSSTYISEEARVAV